MKRISKTKRKKLEERWRVSNGITSPPKYLFFFFFKYRWMAIYCGGVFHFFNSPLWDKRGGGSFGICVFLWNKKRPVPLWQLSRSFLSDFYFFFLKLFFLRDHVFSFSIVLRYPTISIWHHVLSFERRVLSPDRLVRGVCCSMSSLSHTARSFDFSVCLVCLSLFLHPIALILYVHIPPRPTDITSENLSQNEREQPFPPAMECQRLERNSFERVEGKRINSENIQNTGELFWVTTRQERERQTLPSFVFLFVLCLFFFFLFCVFFLGGGYYLGSLRRQRLAHIQERREMKTSSGWSNARGQRKECQTSDCDGVLSGSVGRPLVANTTNYRRLLNCSGTAKLEKFPQTDSQTDKGRRQVYEQHVSVADPVVPSIH